MAGATDSRVFESHKLAKLDCRLVGISVLHA